MSIKTRSMRWDSHYSRNIRPRLVSLESRVVPALLLDFSYLTGLLSISSDAADPIVLSANPDGFVQINSTLFLSNSEAVRTTSVTHIEILGGPGPNTIDVSGLTFAAFPNINRLTNAGDFCCDFRGTRCDRICNFNIYIEGGAGDDTINGSPFADTIDGGLGQDAIDGGRHDDIIAWDFGDSSITGGAGDDRGVLSLDGLAVTTPVITVSSQVATGTVTFFINGSVRTVSSLELLDIDGGDFGGAGTTSITVGSSSSSAHYWKIPPVLDYANSEADETFFGKPKEIVVVGSTSNPNVAQAFSFNFAKVEYMVGGSTGNDIFEVTPGRSKTTIDGGGGADSLSVNHLGLAVTQPAGLVQVAGRVAINHFNVESVTTSRSVFGSAAELELKAAGVSTSAVWSIVGSLEVGTVTIKNQSTLPLTDIQFDLGGPVAAHRTHTPITLTTRADSTIPLRVRSTGGLTATVNPNPQGTPIPDILNGELAYDPRISITATMIPAGGTATFTIETPHSHKPVARYHLENAWPAKMSRGGISYEFLRGWEGSAPPTMRPTVSASLNSTGMASSMAGSELAGTSADGSVVLQLSSAINRDPYVTMVSPGNHVFVNNVMVDTTPAGTSSGNGASSEPVISATGRWVAFATNATNLLSTGLSDSNGTTDIAVRDMFTGKMNVISKTSSGQTGNGKSFAPQISADGRYVFFLSDATNLSGALSDTNGGTDLFRFDTSTSQLVCMSKNAAGTATANKGVHLASVTGAYSISADGKSLAWFSEATDLVIGGSPPGIRGAASKESNFYTIELVETSTDPLGLRVSPDGQHVIFWTAGNLSTLTGVPDTNNVSDLFAWNPVAGKLSALSVNSVKTNMGDGPTPGSPSDAPAISFDGSTIVFTSDADNLVLGLSIPTNDGLFRHKFFSIVDRTDITPSGYGGDNHSPTISPDGRMIAWSSTTNYSSTPGTYSQPQIWVYGVELPAENVSGRYGLSPNFATGRPLLADNGHIAFFDSQSPMAGVDTNSFFDVYASVAHESLVIDFGGTNGSPSIDVETKKLERRYVQVSDSVTNTNLASRPVDTTRWVFLNGADNESNSVTIDYGSGLAGLSDIVFDGGLGTQKDTVNQVGDGGGSDVDAHDYVVWRKVSTATLDLTLFGVEQLSNKLFVGGLTWVSHAEHTATIDLAAPGEAQVSLNYSGMPFDVYFDAKSPLTLIGRGGSSPASTDYLLKVETIGADSEIDINNSLIGVNIDASKANVAVTILSAGNNDTVKGGSGHDELGYFGYGNSAIFGGAGDDTFAFNSFFGASSVVITDTGGRDTLDFSGAGVGINIQLAKTGPQTLTPLGHSLSLFGQFEGINGSAYNDDVLVAFIGGDIKSHGGPSVAGTVGDKLTLDAAGLPAADIGGKIYRAGQLAVVYQDFETIQFINNAPPPQVAAVIVNDGAVQRSMVRSIDIAFNGLINFVGTPASAFELMGPSGVALFTATPQDLNGQTKVRLAFTAAPNIGGSLPDGQYTLRVVSTQISGGLVGGDYLSLPGAIHRLFGDADGNASVSATDFNALRLVYGSIGPSFFDFNADNQVSAFDFNDFRIRYGITLLP